MAIIALYVRVGTFSIPDMMKAGPSFSPQFQFWIFLAFLISFAIKVPMFPFHTWLPAAHVEAPTAGSVLLASVLLKMGAYGFLRFSLPMAPHATQFFTPYILWLSVVAIIYGGLTALAQTDLKKLVAYSSVAHMGFCTLGIFALNEAGLKGALLVMINHGVTTGALFIVVGMIYERLHSRDLERTAGMGKTMPIFALFAGVFALSSLAFPGTNSFIGEFLVMSGGFAIPQATVSKALMVCVVPGIVLAAAYMLRMLQKVAYGGIRNPDHSSLKDLGIREIVTLVPLLVFVFWIGLHPEPFTRVMEASVNRLLQQTQQQQAQDAYVTASPAGKPETRNPKSERSPKPEVRSPKEHAAAESRAQEADTHGDREAKFPSPRPSPEGRGGIAVSASATPACLNISRDCRRFSLSLRERAGVRGIRAANVPFPQTLPSAFRPLPKI